jgi:hypothetical protein
MSRFSLLQSLGYWGYIENMNQMQAEGLAIGFVPCAQRKKLPCRLK